VISLGFMGISLSEFWGVSDNIETGMTLCEYDLFSQGFQSRQEMEHRRTAWLSANIMNCFAKPGKSITPDKLLGTEKPTDHAQMMRDLKEKKRKADEEKQSKILKSVQPSRENQADSGEDFAKQLLDSGAIIGDD
jgi:hypothetical protein